MRRIGGFAGSLALAIGLIATAGGAPGRAQTPPTEAEAVQYPGLHRAAWTGDVAAIERLLASRANPNERDAAGRTPAHVATFAKQRAALEALIKGGADPNALENRKYDIVTIAAVADDVETLRLALSLGASAKLVTSPYDGTALIAAAHLGHDEVVRVLIKAGAPLDHVNNLGWTALIESIVLGNGGKRHVATLKALVEAGARLDLADRSGATPLALARQRGFKEMVAILEKAGAK